MDLSSYAIRTSVVHDAAGSGVPGSGCAEGKGAPAPVAARGAKVCKNLHISCRRFSSFEGNRIACRPGGLQLLQGARAPAQGRGCCECGEPEIRCSLGTPSVERPDEPPGLPWRDELDRVELEQSGQVSG